MIWACGIGDTAVKFPSLERATQILLSLSATKIVLETRVV